jgi:hypothetical protein
MNVNGEKPWYNLEVMLGLYDKEEITSDEDAAEWFVNNGFAVSRRAITDARNALGIPAKTKAAVYEVDLDPPKILFIDIETRPNLGYFWRMYDENIGVNQLVSEHQLLCFAAKWRGVDEMEFYSDHSHGKEYMVRQAHRLLDEADFVVHWNGKKFDIPHINREIILAGMTPPSGYKQLDLMLTARSQFKFVSNKLQHVSVALGFDGKLEHEGFEMWEKCMQGDPEAWAKMEEYNRRDTVLLEGIYDKILPWIKSHPNVPLYSGIGECPHCSSSDIEPHGTAYTNVRTYERFRCNDCGAWMRGTKYKDSTGFVPMSY